MTGESRGEAKPIQFRLRTLLLFLALSAAILSATGTMGIDYRLAVFAIGFLAFIGLVMALIGVSQKHGVVIRVTHDPTEAALCRNYLRQWGVEAEVNDRALPGFGGLTPRLSEVVVPRDQLDKAMALLAERTALEDPEGDP